MTNYYIDATVVIGNSRTFTATVNQRNETDEAFEPLDLDPYSIKFKVLGAPTADAEVLVEHLITGSSDVTTDGLITVPANGEFSFTLTADDTKTLGLGHHPITLEFYNADTNEYVFTLNEGDQYGEFSKINIIEV